ncbi:MAG: hypothetical protein AB4041_01345 [Microcystaceae cyanobacterium]
MIRWIPLLLLLSTLKKTKNTVKIEKILSFVTMTILQASKTQQNKSEVNAQINQEAPKEPILCPHCKRTASNGIRCKGICVSDSDY